jgi:hypothetical protein
MNTQCLNCNAIRTVAALRGSSAVAMFGCAMAATDRCWTHLMHGARLICFEPRQGEHVMIEEPQDARSAEATHGH